MLVAARCASTDLEALAALPHVRSVRRVLDGQYDRVLEPDFIAGIQAVGRHGLPFEFLLGSRSSRLKKAWQLDRAIDKVLHI